MKKTKIICSIGPASNQVEVMEQMVLAGMNVARINFTHATTEERNQAISSVREVRRRTGQNVAILWDTKGPEFRSGMLENDKITLVEGKTIRLVKDCVLGNQERFSVNHPEAVESLNVGNIVLLENAKMKLEVISKENDGVTCKIISGGVLGNKKSMSAPGIKLDIPYLSDEDRQDIKYACDNNGDYLAISFVNSAEDIKQVKELCKEYGRPDMPIISKVETQYAMDNLEEIVEASDYIMVARGDLGIETGVENLPLYQQMMIDTCHAYGKGVIMATQMMYSMKTNIRPTNAEVTDVANAVIAGCDAIMTSDETTIGNYPVETIETMSRICENVEQVTKYNLDEFRLSGTAIHNTIARCAVDASSDLPIKAIVASTLTGRTALDLSSLRPESFIIATVTDSKIARKLALKWGVYTKLVPMYSDTDDIVREGANAAKEVLNLNNDDLVCVIGGFPLDAHTNFLKIDTIK